MHSRFLATLAAAALAAAAACDSPSGEPRPPAPQDLRATVLRGDGQQDTVGQRLADTLIVRVTDAGGRPVPNLTVGWTVLTQGGGEPFLATVRTDADGRARNFWNLGTKAGPHAMEVRAILEGQPVILDTVRATIRPGAAVTAAVSGDTVRAIARLESTRIFLAGADRHGNAIAPGEVAAAWSSSAGAVANVSENGTVVAVAPGRTTVAATGAGWALRVHVTVNGSAQTARTVPFWVRTVHAGGSRMLGAGGGGIAVRVNGEWAAEPGGPSTWLDDVRVLPSGAAWAVGRDNTGYAAWHSPVPGTWTRVAVPAGVEPEHVETAGGTVVIGGLDGNVYARNGNAWAGVGGFPGQMIALAAQSPIEVYAGGTDGAFGSGRGGFVLGRWENHQWTPIAIPASVPRQHNNVVSWLAAPGDGGPVYAVLTTNPVSEVPTHHLLRITGGLATEVPLPPSVAGVRLSGLSMGPGGIPYLSGGNRVIYLVDGVWREHVLVDGWTGASAPFVDGAGTLYVPASRTIGSQAEYGVLEIQTY